MEGLSETPQEELVKPHQPVISSDWEPTARENFLT